jgi:hypothetical protein
MAPAEPASDRARRYAEIMRQGLWRSRPDEQIELRVSENRVMIEDAAHRLAAVVLLGGPVELMVRLTRFQ